ncbi:hypothetical protein H5410_001546 [Solanum commersonii]|uniref:Uncharacterized protein n=1 Tax=Solanum commersonii TaxID=4109 RepID=A0A9J6AZ21_SOLCO|nr:hypothetical protein H5410_001546 [Solanum commersonii]
MERKLACKICEGQARSRGNATNRAKLKMLHHIGSKPIREIIYQKKDNKLVEPEELKNMLNSRNGSCIHLYLL